jgi:hypothetical protein
LHWNNPSIWNRRSADGVVGHQEPVTGIQNFIYCKIKNRGTQIANNVQVHGYHSKQGGGLLLPIDIQSLSTAQISAGTLASNNSEEKIIGPFEWIPEINAYGYDSVIMIVSATDDAAISVILPWEKLFLTGVWYQMTTILDREICFLCKVYPR